MIFFFTNMIMVQDLTHPFLSWPVKSILLMAEFSFPASLSTKQQYKLLGNSISVPGVALLILTYPAPPQVSDPT